MAFEHVARAARRRVLRAQRALPATVGEIQRLEIGRDEVRDARSWDLVLIMEFTSIERCGRISATRSISR